MMSTRQDIIEELHRAFELGDYHMANELRKKAPEAVEWQLSLDPMVLYVGLGGLTLYILGWLVAL